MGIAEGLGEGAGDSVGADVGFISTLVIAEWLMFPWWFSCRDLSLAAPTTFWNTKRNAITKKFLCFVAMLSVMVQYAILNLSQKEV